LALIWVERLAYAIGTSPETISLLSVVESPPEQPVKTSTDSAVSAVAVTDRDD
jgi:hypothetical protein